jgi:hypothetical protein
MEAQLLLVCPLQAELRAAKANIEAVSASPQHFSDSTA